LLPQVRGLVMEVLEQSFRLAKLPMPPSENDQYAARAFPGKHSKAYSGERRSNFVMARICPTHTLEKYQKQVEEEWKAANLVAVYKCKNLLRDWMIKGLYIEVETFAWFPYFDIFTKEGTVRKNDSSNRVKALHDSLARVLEIDDSWFFDSAIRKRGLDKGSPFCSVIFRPVEFLTLRQMKERGEI
jgi:hypothetical protein